jgi:hypothetical protein
VTLLAEAGIRPLLCRFHSFYLGSERRPWHDDLFPEASQWEIELHPSIERRQCYSYRNGGGELRIPGRIAKRLRHGNVYSCRRGEDVGTPPYSLAARSCADTICSTRSYGRGWVELAGPFAEPPQKIHGPRFKGIGITPAQHFRVSLRRTTALATMRLLSWTNVDGGIDCTGSRIPDALSMAIATTPPQHWQPPIGVPLREPSRSRLIEYFVVVELICQLALLSHTLAPFRIVFRTAVFGLSLGLLFVLPGHGKHHPAAKAAFLVMVTLAVSMANPGVNSAMAAAAQFAIYLAVLAPLFWVSRIRIDLAEMRRVILLLWGFQVISSIFGVLQVYFPERFQFAVSTVVQGAGAAYVGGLQFQTAYGEMAYRPMGLTDTPGGAAAAGYFAVLFAAAVFLLERRRWMQIVSAGAMLIGMMAIYLSQVRMLLVMEMTCMLAFLTLMSWRVAQVSNPLLGRRIGSKRLAYLTGLMALAAAGGFTWAVGVGGTAITDRLNSLTEGNPGEVYQKNRGLFLTYTIDEVLPEYPLGAGPGRWGMMFYYFGDKSNAKNPGLWAEIQWTGWLYDGGVALVLLYTLAIAIAFRTAYIIALNRRSTELATLAAVVFAYNVGALAATFDSCFFIGGTGLDFWMINAMLFNAAYHTLRKPAPKRTEAARA